MGMVITENIRKILFSYSSEDVSTSFKVAKMAEGSLPRYITEFLFYRIQ